MNELKDFISDKSKLSIRNKCNLLGVPRSSFYHQEPPESEENLKLMEMMDKRHLDHPTHGVLQMQDYLFFQSFLVNHKRVRRLLRKMGIIARYPRRNLSKLGHAQYIKPYLLRNLVISRPNQVWAIDITYIPMRKGFMYLTAIIDVYSRFVVGWDIFNSLDAANSLNVLKDAIERYGKPEIVNSDQGSQFTCSLWIDYLLKEEIKISMDGKGRATDNIFIERLWRTVKQDYVYLYPAENGTELFLGLKKFFHFYNHEKSHQGIERERPVNLYRPAA
jgi:putative transposase